MKIENEENTAVFSYQMLSRASSQSSLFLVIRYNDLRVDVKIEPLGLIYFNTLEM